MESSIAPAAHIAPPSPQSAESLWKRLVDYVVRRRVRITLIVFVVLISEDVLECGRPHDLTNLRDMKTVLGLSLVLAGLALRSWAAGILRKQAQLATGGPYSLVRHPLYTGSFMMMLGFCTLIDDAENIWFILGPLAGLYLLGVLSEERMLLTRFGTRWREYTASVPRFIPRRLRPGVFGPWTVSQWKQNREYRAVCAAMLGLAAIQAWHRFL
jgi:protein-S-isoprenylcysteine O-methyltransferase Ste14